MIKNNRHNKQTACYYLKLKQKKINEYNLSEIREREKSIEIMSKSINKSIDLNTTLR